MAASHPSERTISERTALEDTVFAAALELNLLTLDRVPTAAQVRAALDRFPGRDWNRPIGRITPLVYVLARGALAAVDELMARGAGVHQTNAQGLGPMHMLLEQRVRDCQQDDLPLLVEGLRWLLAHGADVNERGDLGATPVHAVLDFPARERDVCLTVLVEAGADLTVSGPHLPRPEDVAHRNRDTAVAAWLRCARERQELRTVVADEPVVGRAARVM